MGKIQAVLFNRNYYNQERAEKWLINHGLIKIKPMHFTEHFIRARIRDPNMFHHFITTKHHKKNIEFIIGF